MGAAGTSLVLDIVGLVIWYLKLRTAALNGLTDQALALVIVAAAIIAVIAGVIAIRRRGWALVLGIVGILIGLALIFAWGSVLAISGINISL